MSVNTINVKANKAKSLLAADEATRTASPEFKKFLNANAPKFTEGLYASDETRQSIEKKTDVKFRKYLKGVVSASTKVAE